MYAFVCEEHVCACVCDACNPTYASFYSHMPKKISCDTLMYSDIETDLVLRLSFGNRLKMQYTMKCRASWRNVPPNSTTELSRINLRT